MVLGALFPAILIYGGLCDIATYRIPNWLSVTLVACFPIAAWTGGLPVSEILMHFAAGVTIFAVGTALFALRLLGGGDVKLLAAAAVWTGFSLLGPFLLVMAFAGGAMALILLVARRLPLAKLRRHKGWGARLLSPSGKIPYGAAIAIAGIVMTARAGGNLLFVR